MYWKNEEMDLVYRDAEGNYLHWTAENEAAEVELWLADADADPDKRKREEIRAWFGSCPVCHRYGAFFQDGITGYLTCQAHRLAWCYGWSHLAARNLHRLEMEQESQVLRANYTDVTEVVFRDARAGGYAVVWSEEPVVLSPKTAKKATQMGRHAWGQDKGYRHPHKAEFGPLYSVPEAGVLSMRDIFAASDARNCAAI